MVRFKQVLDAGFCMQLDMISGLINVDAVELGGEVEVFHWRFRFTREPKSCAEGAKKFCGMGIIFAGKK